MPGTAILFPQKATSPLYNCGCQALQGNSLTWKHRYINVAVAQVNPYSIVACLVDFQHQSCIIYMYVYLGSDMNSYAFLCNIIIRR